MTNAITEQELTEARQIWGDALVAISKAFDTDGIESARAVANGAIDAAYGYNLGPVLFKPLPWRAENKLFGPQGKAHWPTS